MNARLPDGQLGHLPTLSVVVPVFNEADGLLAFHQRTVAALADAGMPFEIVYVDDGSSDKSLGILKRFHASDPRICVVGFSRNFGKEAAMAAGLRKAKGDAVVVMDADLQHPPELISQMVHAWQEHGVDLVNMRRQDRRNESLPRRLAARAFYRVMNRLSDVPIPEDVGDFRLLSRRAVDALNQLEERNRFMKGLFAWIGFKQATLDYDVEDRFAGTSKWRMRSLWKFAIEGLVAFSVAPLKLASYIGLLSAAGAFAYGTYFLVKALVSGDRVQGFPTLIVTILFLGGLQLMATGIVGEYLGRLFIENKRRPLYFVEEYLPSEDTVLQPLPAAPSRQGL